MMSPLINALWAKKSNVYEEGLWLPLPVHMADAAETAGLLWNQWVPDCTRQRIANGLCNSYNRTCDLEDMALRCFVFLSAGHDLGKAIPAFQSKHGHNEIDGQLRRQISDSGLPLLNNIHNHEARHYWASQLILEKHGFDRKLAVILGGHHGHPPDNAQLNALRGAFKRDLGWDKEQENWREAQQALVTYALELANISREEAQSWQPDITAQVLLSGLVIMTDWIVSNEVYFPYADLTGIVKPSAARAESAWRALNLPECWNPGNLWMDTEYYKKRFDFEPRPLQTAALRLIGDASCPGMVILEAPMGEGKTEAALAAAEVMAYNSKRSGIFFALPTQASANGLFLRICRWIERLEDGIDHSVSLAHGKADLNELYNKIKDATNETVRFRVGGTEEEETGDDAIIVHEWFSGRKKGILSDFVIGTIDQVLMAGLKQKHLVLRHLGLVNKVVILDECHAYDAYMNRYLYKVLNWLGAYEVPVIVLSATLPGSKRMQLIEAYLNSAPEPEYDPLFDREMAQAPPLPSWANTHDYPIITYTDGGEISQEKIGGKQRSIKVKLDILPEDERIVSVLEHLLSEGGCAGIIVNTVKRAQQIAYNLSQIFGNECILLLHSRFIAADRAQKEKELYEKLSVGGERPHRYIAVGTQIFEQSCDLDFDVLISDICPMDLLIQRIGRLHRHRRSRPVKLKAPRCFILGMNDSGFDRGAEIIYGKYLLMNTRARLPDQITLPDDIPQLVQQVYGTGELCFSPEIQDEYDEAKKLHEKRISEKEVKAQDFQIYNPNVGTGNLVGWLDRKISDDPSGKRGEATVRDVENSLEVIVVQRRHNAYYMLPRSGKHSDQYDQYEQYKERKISTDTPPAAELAREMAACSIQLPHELCRNMDNTIGELEKLSLKELRVWQQSSWLKGELFLVLDEQYCADLCGYQLRYDQYYGMFSNKNDKGDEDAGERI